jgi:hypothetical protein
MSSGELGGTVSLSLKVDTGDSDSQINKTVEKVDHLANEC